MAYLFHGSNVADITHLEARSKLHGADEYVIYLTDHVPYALFYIWDAAHTGTQSKHVTGWTKDGIAFYEEQFPDQLRTFYQGVSGYLYYVNETPCIQSMQDRQNIFYSTEDMPIVKKEWIPDIYDALQEYERVGLLKVLRYSEQSKERQKELTEMIAVAIRRNNFFEQDKEYQAFMQRYFAEAWEYAKATS